MDTYEEKSQVNVISVELKADGLPEDVVRKLDAALKTTLMTELASLNIAPAARINLSDPFRPWNPIGDGRTWGIWFEYWPDLFAPSR